MSKNVLLLALSTFYYNKQTGEHSLEKVSRFRYQMDNGAYIYVNGHYQLEPVPGLLWQMGQTIDAVIMLSTEETSGKVEVLLADDIVEKSPQEYFTDWLREAAEKNGKTAPVCIPVPVDAERPAAAIQLTVQELERLNREEKIRLYVDTHGGFRSIQQILEAIIKLWKSDTLELNVFNVRYDNSDSKDKVSVIEQDQAIRIFDFFSGINEFMNYGRIDSLLRYLNYEENKDLLDPILEISEGIQWCNIVKFESGLRHLKNYYRKGKKEISDQYLKIFEERIRRDYDKLLEADSIDDAVVMVRWCMKKGFYQQALTLIEAKMPGTWLDKRHIAELTGAGKEFKKKHHLYENQSELDFVDMINGCLAPFKDWMKAWSGSIDNPMGRRKFNEIFYSDRSGQVSLLTEEVLKLLCNRQGRINTDYFIKEISGYHNTQIGSCEQAIAFPETAGDSGDAEQRKRYIIALFFMHRTLKEIRNASNHALEKDSYDSAAIRNAIHYYLNLVDWLTIK